jgi:hypothetical protein
MEKLSLEEAKKKSLELEKLKIDSNNYNTVLDFINYINKEYEQYRDYYLVHSKIPSLKSKLDRFNDRLKSIAIYKKSKYYYIIEHLVVKHDLYPYQLKLTNNDNDEYFILYDDKYDNRDLKLEQMSYEKLLKFVSTDYSSILINGIYYGPFQQIIKLEPIISIAEFQLAKGEELNNIDLSQFSIKDHLKLINKKD